VCMCVYVFVCVCLCVCCVCFVCVQHVVILFFCFCFVFLFLCLAALENETPKSGIDGRSFVGACLVTVYTLHCSPNCIYVQIIRNLVLFCTIFSVFF